CPLCDVRVVDMRDHVGHHILRALTNTLEEPPLKQEVGLTSPCGFCGCSGVPECTIRITVPSSGAPTWETGCKYKHLFRYGSVDSGSKNKPCRNLPLKCGLCHPVLPPQPGKSTCKAPVLAVEAVWRYNMAAHILDHHNEYAVPGQREAGVPLPMSVWKVMKLTDLEQSASHIP
ncbi:hypothetical protein CY34DRAFT_31162, partial [Suillus luteus UH-Slu-Lm8-n1]